MRGVWLLVTVVTCAVMIDTVAGAWWRPWSGWWGRRPPRQWYCRKSKYSPTTFSTPRLPDVRTIVGTCTADLGRCPIGQCRYNSARPSYCDKDGYICPVNEAIEVSCGNLGNFQVNKVTGCTCCKDEGIVLNVRVRSAENQESLADVEVTTASKHGVTNSEGGFTTKIASTTSKVVVYASDPTGAYVYSVHVEEIPTAFRGPVNVDISMVKKSEPVQFDSRDATTLSISSDPSNADAGPARIIIRPNSFRRGWRRYRGTVQASITFLNTSDASTTSLLPGQFRTNDGMDLISDGVFALEFTDNSGRPLRPPTVTVEVDSGMRLWTLSSQDGRWQSLGRLRGRKKRQASFDSISAAIPNAIWVNIDKIPQTPDCFFKARIFDMDTGNEIASSTSAQFKPRGVTFVAGTPLRRLGTYFSPTSTPANTCHRVRCSTSTTSLFGLVNMTSYENIDINGTIVPEVKVLSPRPLSQYSNVIRDAHLSVKYQVVGLDIFANHILNATGPFYSDEATCKNSSVDEPAFHFMKPSLPPVVPAPENTTKCVARIGFFQSFGNFTDLVNDLNTSLKLTALSKWTSPDGSIVYLTSTAYLHQSGNGTFFVACVEYRCSDASASTTVYLSIDVPTTASSTNGTGPAFMCYKSCGEFTDCPPQQSRRRRATSPTTLGQFTAPNNVTNGPDFYADPANSDCASRTENEAFAARFHCFTR